MNIFRSFVILALIAATVSFLGCGGKTGSQNNAGSSNRAANVNGAAKNKANDNAEELGMLINLQTEPEDLVWKVDEKKKMLIAVMRYAPADAGKLSNQLTARSAGAPREISTEEWFPAELIAQGESGGNAAVEGTSFTADDFFQPPYTEGTITRINGTDFFVLELNAK